MKHVALVSRTPEMASTLLDSKITFLGIAIARIAGFVLGKTNGGYIPL